MAGPWSSHTADCDCITATGTSSPIVVPGLTTGTSYTCKVPTTNTVVPEVAEPPVTYFHNDISGSPMLATDGAGTVLQMVAMSASKPCNLLEERSIPDLLHRQHLPVAPVKYTFIAIKVGVNSYCCTMGAMTEREGRNHAMQSASAYQPTMTAA